MPYLEIDGAALYYDVRGDGAPVALLHGFTSSFARNWSDRSWVEFLTDNESQVVGVDFRSHGRSSRVETPAAATTRALAGDVLRVLDHLAIDRAHAFGFSMGGGVALYLAMNYPDRVDSVVVAGVGDAAINELHNPEDVSEIAAAFERRPDEPPRTRDAERIRRGAETAGNDLTALAPFLHTGGWPGGLDARHEVPVPVLVVAAANDQYMATIDELIRWLPHAEVQRVPDADHYTVLDVDAVRDRVVDFLRTARS
jgi:pimeloyl-ACP methyl ester carboxylesterase